jgi:hypothetical protein
VPKQKPPTIKLQVFKGREAKPNKAILHILALKSPQTIYEIHKETKKKELKQIPYASINRRARTLEESEYIQKVGIRKTKAGYEAHVYELNAKGYLATILGFIDLNDLLRRTDDQAASTILSEIIRTRFSDLARANLVENLIHSKHSFGKKACMRAQHGEGKQT